MNDRQKQRADYLHYSSVGIQMVLTILLFTFLGTRLDRHFELKKPIWTAILAIFGVVVAMIFMLKSFLKPPSKKSKDSPDDEKEKTE